MGVGVSGGVMAGSGFCFAGGGGCEVGSVLAWTEPGHCGIYLLTTASGGIRRQIPPPPWPLGLRGHALQQRQPKQSGNRHEPKRTGSGYPHRRSGSEADSMSRGGYPVTGRASSKSSSIGHTPSNEAILTRATPDRNQSAPGAGTPTGDFWKRSGQHEPRRVPGHGAPSSKPSSIRHRLSTKPSSDRHSPSCSVGRLARR